jgi:hypothetical protein
MYENFQIPVNQYSTAAGLKQSTPRLRFILFRAPVFLSPELRRVDGARWTFRRYN